MAMKIQASRLAMIAGFLFTFGGFFGGPMLFFGLEAVYPLEKMSETEVIIVGAAGILVTFILPAIGITLIFGSFLVPMLFGIRTRAKIEETGIAATARILGTADTGTRINTNPVVRFDLQVNPPAAPAFQTQVEQTVSIIHLPLYQPGKTVNVKFIAGTQNTVITGPAIEGEI
jgi:hypothetical protein